MAGNHTGRFKSADIDHTTQLRLKYRESQQFLVDTIFPCGAMHLIGGPSGIGKTTWLMQQLHEWEQERQLFGSFASHAKPWVYIGCDRSLREFDATLCRLGYSDWQFEAHALETIIHNKQTKGFDSPKFADHILKRFPKADLIVIEGLQALMPDNSKSRSQNKNELLWALEQRFVLAEQNKTVIATTHNPKVAQLGASSTDERSKFLGSQGFIGSCSTMVGFEKDEAAGENMRKVTIMGRNFKDIKLRYSVNENGMFDLEVDKDNKPVQTEDDDHVQFITWCQAQVEPFTVMSAQSWCMKMGIPGRNADRWLLKAIDQRFLERLKDGNKFKYRRRTLQDVSKDPDRQSD